MSTHYDFKKEWEKTRGKLAQFSKEAMTLAKKGEKELVDFSRKGKLHVDATAVSLKKEKLYYLIGREYANNKTPEAPTQNMIKLLDELNKANKEQTSLNRKINSTKKKARKKTKNNASA